MVTVLRRSCAATTRARDAPQLPHVTRSAGLSAPQDAHSFPAVSASDFSASRTARSASAEIASSRYGVTGCGAPLGVMAGKASTLTRSRICRYVDGARSTSSGGALCSIAVAVTLTAPLSTCWPEPSSSRTTSPVAIPVLTSKRMPYTCANWSFRLARVRRLSAAAATARSASSSWSTGRPNTTTMASPMIFSMVPPWDSNTVRISWK